MNPSYEYMRRIRLEEQAKLLDMRRERVVKALDGLTLHGDANAMLTQIAYSVHPHVGAWDAESCDHLRRVLAELIGDAGEAASGAEHRCACGAGGCDRGNEQTEIETERQEAVSRLRKLGKCSPFAHGFRDALAAAVAVPKDGAPYDDGELCHLICDRLIHLLGGDLSHDTSHTKQESETGNVRHSRTCPESDGEVSESAPSVSITDELREYVSIHETMTTVYATMPPQMEDKPTHKGEKLLAIADEIDARVASLAHDVETWHNRAEDMCIEYDELQVKLGELQASLDELERFDPEISIAAFGDDNEELRKLLSRSAKLLADAERDRDQNYHLWMDCKQKVLQSNITVGELEEERDELQDTIADLNEQLERRKAKCLRYKTHIDQMQGGSKRLRKELREQEGTYLDLLRDAAMDYKELRDKLYHVVRVCQIYTEANA